MLSLSFFYEVVYKRNPPHKRGLGLPPSLEEEMRPFFFSLEG